MASSAARKPKAATVSRETKRRAAKADGPALVLTRPDVQIEQWAIGRLKPYARNSRTHSDEQIASIAKSIERFGFTNPILVAEDGTIIAGHGRTLAAGKLGLKTLPVIVASGWSDDERRAYVITDNKVALDAGWDEDILKLELGELSAAGFDLEVTGFDEDDLNQLFGTIGSDVKPPPVIKTTFQILIECSDEAAQLQLLEELQTRAIECRALIS